MALTPLERDTLARGMAVAKQLLFDFQPKISSLHQLYDSVGGVGTTLTQEDLDSLPELSGLTKQQVDDALYPLTTVILSAIEDALPALTQLSARTL